MTGLESAELSPKAPTTLSLAPPETSRYHGKADENIEKMAAHGFPRRIRERIQSAAI